MRRGTKGSGQDEGGKGMGTSSCGSVTLRNGHTRRSKISLL